MQILTLTPSKHQRPTLTFFVKTKIWLGHVYKQGRSPWWSSLLFFSYIHILSVYILFRSTPSLFERKKAPFYFLLYITDFADFLFFGLFKSESSSSSCFHFNGSWRRRRKMLFVASNLIMPITLQQFLKNKY